jgi:hypothetical protein
MEAKLSMENRLAWYKQNMDDVQLQIANISNDLDTVISAMRAKGIDTMPYVHP